MKEVVEGIENILGEGGSLLDLHSLQQKDGLDPYLFWMQVKLILNLQMWSATIAEQAGVTIEPVVAEYIHNMNAGVKNRLLILSNKPFGS